MSWNRSPARETTIDGKVVISCAPQTFLNLVSPWVGESGSQAFATFSVNTIAYFDLLVFFCATGCWKSRPGKAYKNFVYDRDAYNAVYDQHSIETEFKFENPDKRFDLLVPHQQIATMLTIFPRISKPRMQRK